MFERGDRFSRTCTRIRQIQGGTEEAIEDVFRFGGDWDCVGLVFDGIDRKLREALREGGFKDEDEFNEELERRTSPKYAYFSALRVFIND